MKYVVYRRSAHEVFRIWLPEHWQRYNVSEPRADDPAVRYTGEDYPAALAAADRANRLDAVHGRYLNPPPAPARPVVAPAKPKEPSTLFG